MEHLGPVLIPGPMCDWPSHFYVNGIVGERIHCMATGCTVTFSSVAPRETLLEHYKDMCCVITFEADTDYEAVALSRIEHGLLIQMWNQEKCLLCAREFPENHPRVAFGHYHTNHKGSTIFTTIPGFLSMVRQYYLINHSAKYQRDTFLLSFEHAKLRLTTPPLDHDFNTLVMGHRTDAVPYAKCLEVLTIPGEIQFFPIHPAHFLSLLRFDPTKCSYTEKQWKKMWNSLREKYNTGKT